MPFAVIFADELRAAITPFRHYAASFRAILSAILLMLSIDYAITD